jgi:hypothetical protein
MCHRCCRWRGWRRSWRRRLCCVLFCGCDNSSVVSRRLFPNGHLPLKAALLMLPECSHVWCMVYTHAVRLVHHMQAAGRLLYETAGARQAHNTRWPTDEHNATTMSQFLAWMIKKRAVHCGRSSLLHGLLMPTHGPSRSHGCHHIYEPRIPPYLSTAGSHDVITHTSPEVSTSAATSVNATVPRVPVPCVGVCGCVGGSVLCVSVHAAVSSMAGKRYSVRTDVLNEPVRFDGGASLMEDLSTCCVIVALCP